MSTTATPPTAAPAATPTVTPPTEKKTVPKELLKRLAKGQPDAPEKPVTQSAVTTTPPAATTPAAPATTPPATPEATTPPPARVKKKDRELPPLPTATPPPVDIAAVVKQTLAESHQPPAAPAAPVLTDEQQRDLELAKFAAEKYPDRYKALPEQIVSFATERTQHLAAKAAEFGGGTSPEFRDYLQSDDYKTWQREHQPAYQRGDRQKLYEEWLEERGARRTLEKIKPELEETNRKILAMQQQPIIQQTVATAVKTMLTDTSTEKDEAIVEFDKNPQGFLAENEIEGSIILRSAQQLKERAEETLRITSGLVDLSKVVQPTETQQWIDDYVTRLETGIEQANGGRGLPRDDGKILVSQRQMASIPSHQRANYRTLLPNEIVGAMAVDHQVMTKNELKAERERLQRAGFQRIKKTTTPPQSAPAPLPSSPASPLASSSAAPGIGARSPANTEPWWKKFAQSK